MLTNNGFVEILMIVGVVLILYGASKLEITKKKPEVVKPAEVSKPAKVKKLAKATKKTTKAKKKSKK